MLTPQKLLNRETEMAKIAILEIAAMRGVTEEERRQALAAVETTVHAIRLEDDSEGVRRTMQGGSGG
jgi:hypothetical protein